MVKDWKKDAVAELAKTISGYSSIMITDLTGLPAKEMQELKFNLKDNLKVIVCKKAIIKRALEKLKMNPLAEDLPLIPAIMISNTDPFELSIMLDKKKVPSFIKPGQKSDVEITIPAGGTNFAPGPVLTELADLGLKTKIEGGKIKILKEKKVAEIGDSVDEKTASMLKKLDIKPSKIGINIYAAFEDGKVFKNIHVKLEDFENAFKRAHSEAFSLAYNSGIVNSDTVKLLIGKAHSEAFSLAINAKIYNSETLPIILAEANIHASALMGV